MAVIAWYLAWKQDKEKEGENGIYVYADIEINFDDGTCLIPTDCGYKVAVNITNQNISTPIKVDYVQAFHKKRQRLLL